MRDLWLLFLNGIFLTNFSYGFNLSPRPNIIVRDPQLPTHKPKLRSTYFGFSLVLRPSGLFVGAPRAQSTLAAQQELNETGAIYRCTLPHGTCAPFIFDDGGNVLVAAENEDPYIFTSKKRDYQWLGASMDGGIADTDKLLVCAPRYITPKYDMDYLMNGLCYWIKNTLSEKPTGVLKIAPLSLKSQQKRCIKPDQSCKSNETIYNHYYAQMGASVHVTANNEMFLIGTPGELKWRGTVVHYFQSPVENDDAYSRRDVQHRRAPRSEERQLESKSNVLEALPHAEDSYVGYAVGSGYFDGDNVLMYIATAPHASEQSGEAYLYDVLGHALNKRHVFRGSQFGEYFGYAILVEDLNNDGLSDVIIAAPQYSTAAYADVGAIYLFINRGRLNFDQKLLISPVRGMTRFGTTLTSLGDINRDGYNDIAVGAPFANGNGSVFIYLGAAHGLASKPSQQLSSTNTSLSSAEPHMFGHGLAKACDIDGNGFNDLAVGAPNAEAVFLYRAYPVVKIFATIVPESREVKVERDVLNLNVCYHIETSSPHVRQQNITLLIELDRELKRVQFLNESKFSKVYNVTAGLQQTCMLVSCKLSYIAAYVFNPLELEVHYDIIDGVPDSEVFCKHCAAVNPADPKSYTAKASFSTGCAGGICVADLRVKSVGVNPTFLLGSSKKLTVTYEILNLGESAYLPQINVTSANRLHFLQISTACHVTASFHMLCNLNGERAMLNGSKAYIDITYDVSEISGKTLNLTAHVLSAGKEATPSDNSAIDLIKLIEFTRAEITGITKNPYINLEDTIESLKVTNMYQIQSFGPSNVNDMELFFDIPVAFKVPGTNNLIPIMDISDISMEATYDSQQLVIDFIDQNQVYILMRTIESSRNSKASYAADKVPAAAPQPTAPHIYSPAELTRIYQSYDLLSDHMQQKVLINRTLVLNCNDTAMAVCLRARMRIYNFRAMRPISVTLKYQLQLKAISYLLSAPWECLVMHIGVDLIKSGVAGDKSLSVKQEMEYTVVSKHSLYQTYFWTYVLGVLVGGLILALLMYSLHRTGFFERAKKDELLIAKRIKAANVDELNDLCAE